MQLNQEVNRYLDDHEGEFDRCRNDGYLDIDSVARELGVRIFEVKFTEPDISGAIRKDGEDWEIYVNKDHHINRKRFTAAHELGHYISYQVGSFSKDYLDQNGILTDTMYRKNGESNEKEVEANIIAAEILMPQPIIESFIKDNYSVDEIAKRLGVSMEAVSYRIRNIGYEIIL